jgi:hypothetical protein
MKIPTTSLVLTEDYLSAIPETLIQARAQVFCVLNQVMNESGAAAPTSARVDDICRLSNAVINLTLASLTENRVKFVKPSRTYLR